MSHRKLRLRLVIDSESANVGGLLDRSTLIYAAYDVAHNGALVLKAFLDRRL